MQPIIVQDYEKEAAIKFGDMKPNSNENAARKDSSVIDVSSTSSLGDQWKD
jgi:hypothetical protein